MAELTKKKRIRAGHKASATRTTNKVTEALDADPVNVTTLSLLKLTLKEKLDVIKTLNAEVIELIVEDEAITAEIEQADEYGESIHAALLRIETELERHARVPDRPAVTTPPAREPRPTAPATTVKLPRLKLRSFSGDLTQWTPFWESFEAAVHSNPSLSPVEKFNYLTSVLEGTAREAIAGLSLTAANYTEAIATLKKRFGNKQKIINKHMDDLLKTRAVQSCIDVKGLRQLHDQVSSHIRSLKSLDVTPETYGGLLCLVLIARLPAELQLIVSRKVSEQDWNLDELMEVIEEEVAARERVSVMPLNRPRHTERKLPPSATTLVADTKGASVSCCYRGKEHIAVKCDTVTEADARKQVLRKSGPCFQCLRKGHLSRDCRTKHRCHTCNGRHHTSICVPRESTVPDPPLAGTGSAKTESTTTLNPSAPEFTPIEGGTSLHLNTKAAILLQTAVADVYNPDKHAERQKVRIVMDSGSQCSYLTDRVRHNLKLKTSGTQQLSIAAFGTKRARAKPCEVVRVCIKTKSGEGLPVDLFVVPHICDPLTAQPVSDCSRRYSHHSDLELADGFDGSGPVEVDVLLGSDVYWEFATGEVIRGPEGPIGVGTKLGWVL